MGWRVRSHRQAIAGVRIIVLTQEENLYLPAAWGITRDRLCPHWISTPSGPVAEALMSVVQWLGRRAALFGGGHLRQAPL